MSQPLNPSIDVPAGEEPAATCPHCGRPFDGDRFRDLHVGEHHEGVATEAELDAAETAREEEYDELFFYHVKIVVALGLIYAAIVFLYMAALGSGFL